MAIAFKINYSSNNSLGRIGEIDTYHGKIETPVFMPVGTNGTVKAMMPESIKQAGSTIILANTYHLMLRPGIDRVVNAQGLHKMMNWHAPILTDSGGFQVMSLAKLCKISEEGVVFQSHIDGNEFLLNPEISTDVQYKLGSTISMAFDQCIAYPASYAESKDAMLLSMRWAKRSRDAFVDRLGYGQFGIVQGGVFADLRRESVEKILEIDFDGIAIGGLAVGEGQKIMLQVLDDTIKFIPQKYPRYLMGVGKPTDIVGAVLQGIDMFDCVIPSRSGRNALAYTSLGTVNLYNASNKFNTDKLDPNCSCPACTDYSRDYLHHLFNVKEMLGSMLLTWHNIKYYQDLMKNIRNAIKNNDLNNFFINLKEIYQE